jgi:hypothetical protein
MLFLLIEWTYAYTLLEKLLASGISSAFNLLNQYGFVWGLPEFPLLIVLFVGILVIFTLNAGYKLWFRVSALVILMSGIAGLVLFSHQPVLEVRIINETPVVFHRDTEEQVSLILPPGSRLDRYTVSKIGRMLRKKGSPHLDYLVSDYSRRLFSQFDPSLSVEKFVPYWQNNFKESTVPTHFDVGELQLKSSLATIHFSTSDELSIDSFSVQGIFASTGDGRCLVNDVSVLTSETLNRLERTSCKVTFLREKPLVYTMSDPSGTRGAFKPTIPLF